MKTNDRVQRHTDNAVNERIREAAHNRVRAVETAPERVLSARIRRLDSEWDIERWLEMNASALAFTGTILGLLWNRKFLAIPCFVLSFLFLHAVQGWCPPVPILRRRGVRTRGEIDEEKFALKALRGDFAGVESREERDRSERAWRGATN